MRIFEHQGNKYLMIKDHAFHILNAFRSNGDDIYIQCTTNSSSGLILEYLPKGYGLSKARYNGQMIFTIFKKSQFAYKSKSKSLGTLFFIALSNEGAKYLLYRWILNEKLELDDTEKNIGIVKDFFANKNNRIRNIRSIVKDQKMQAVSINMNDWHMVYDLADIKEEIEKQVA